MKYIILITALLFVSCGHADWMLKEVKADGQKIGVVRWGHGPKGGFRQKDAYREIEGYCGSSAYRVVREYGQDGAYQEAKYVGARGVTVPTGGGPGPLYTYIEFICNEIN